MRQPVPHHIQRTGKSREQIAIAIAIGYLLTCPEGVIQVFSICTLGTRAMPAPSSEFR